MDERNAKPPVRLDWTVRGMDCPACSAKIRSAVEAVPGVSEVQVSVMSETMGLRLDEGLADAETIERLVSKLGYTVTPRRTSTQAASHAYGGSEKNDPVGDRGPARAPVEPAAEWHQTAKGRLVIITGVLLASAWTIKLVALDHVAAWGFIIACVIGLLPVARRAVAALGAGIPFTIEMLMTIAATGALFIGAAEEAALVVFLFAIGEVLEGVAANRARASIRALGDLVPKTALLVEAGGTRKVEAESLRIGQVVLVRPGDRVPADGEILDGTSGIDESPVTGESLPRTKVPGDDVWAGSINTEAVLRIRVTSAPADNTIARIVRLVEEAQEARAPTDRFVDRFSRVYMPAIVGLALLVAIVPTLGFGGEWDTWVYRALALLLIGCPCALVISVPASFASSLAAGARHGLLMKGGAVIESAAQTTLVAFDKTGTLTVGRPEVTDVVAFTLDRSDVLALAAGVEAGSSHPLAEAILIRAESDGVTVPRVTESLIHVGRGVEAVIGNETIFVGSPRFAVESGVRSAEGEENAAILEAEGKTVAAVFRNGALLGLIAMRDQPRADASEAVVQLRSLGVGAVMLSGDNARTAAAIANSLGMDHRSELLPDEKVAAIREMTRSNRVMMVGDGINDAPALAAAHVGMAMGSGTDLALETADGALLRNRVTDVAGTIRLARATMATIHQNIGIALGLKGVFLVTTVLGMTGLWLAILADTGATVLVTLNAVRLLGFDVTKRPDQRP